MYTGKTEQNRPPFAGVFTSPRSIEIVTVYSKPDCQQCRLTMNLLDKLNIGYRYFDVSTDEQAMKWVREMGYMSVPVVVPSFDKDVRNPKGEKIDHWSGFRPDLLDQLVPVQVA